MNLNSKVVDWIFEMDYGRKHRYRLSEKIWLESLCLKHIPYIFPKDLCNCILIKIKEKNILFLSDCSFEETKQFQSFSDLKIDACFVNPYFCLNKNGKVILQDIIKPNKMILYHIPFENDDSLNIRSLAKQCFRIYENIETIILQEPLQTIIV